MNAATRQVVSLLTVHMEAVVTIAFRGSQLTVYASRSQKVRHHAIVDWILDEVKGAGIKGATVVSCSEGIGSDGHYHAAHFFELADEPVAIAVVAGDEQIDALLSTLNAARTKLFYTRFPVEYGTLGDPEEVCCKRTETR